MADLLGGPATSNGNGGSSSRPTAPPAQTGSPSQGIRGPRMIMRERAEREARQRAEREQMERNRAEQEARALEEQQRRAAERRQQQQQPHTAAGAAAGMSGGDIPPQQTMDPATQRRQQRTAEAQAQQQAAAAGSSRIQQQQQQQQQSAAAPQQAQTPIRPTRVATSGQPPQGYTPGGPSAAAPPQPSAAAAAAGAQPAEPSAAGPSSRVPRNSFPHAFERWEALSAHWEGLTSFWIRSIRERSKEIEGDPLSQQLARQVQDLSAAGANLFHAVVELQRLRASSERKFQRWFFETRAELERHQEVNAMMESALEEERRGRADAIRDAVEHERLNSKTQKQLTEMRKELMISKEEARRAWEELGRREQEERDRTLSLQQGMPTIVGGVQVVPMTQGVPSRQTSTRDPRSQGQPDPSEYATAQASGYSEYTQAPPVQPTASSAPVSTSAGGYYHHHPEAAEPGHYRTGSGSGYSEGEYIIDANGNFVRDAQGNKIPFRDPLSPRRPSAAGGGESDDGVAEEYETPATSGPTTSYPPSSSHWATGHQQQQQQPPPQQQYSSAPGGYTGDGYAAPGWETVTTTPRHHHPTRLSDVIEEDDERSRTTASQVSRNQ